MQDTLFPRDFVLAESVDDGFTTEHFIETPVGRMSVRIPNFLGLPQTERRLHVIVNALNHPLQF